MNQLPLSLGWPCSLPVQITTATNYVKKKRKSLTTSASGTYSGKERELIFISRNVLSVFIFNCVQPLFIIFFFFTKQLQIILPIFSCYGNAHTSSSFELTPQFPEGSSFCAWRLQFKLVLRAFMGGENIVTLSLSSEAFWASVGSCSLLPGTLEGTSVNPSSSFETNDYLLSQHLENPCGRDIVCWWADQPLGELYTQCL